VKTLQVEPTQRPARLSRVHDSPEALESRMRPALIKDAKLLVTEPTLVKHGDRTVLVYDWLKTDFADLERACIALKFGRSFRSEGLPTQSRTFGFAPRLEFRIGRNCCSATALASESPQAEAAIRRWAVELSELFKRHDPIKYEEQRQLLEKLVLPEWRLPGGLFTSGIINKNNALRYHTDAGNFKDCWSAMIVIPSRCKGGALVVPELGITLQLDRHASVVLFNGAQWRHGVTPIEVPKMGYRFSIVYYAMSRMRECLPFAEEMARATAVRTQVEKNRLDYKAGGSFDPNVRARSKR
jgi:hypothetical protein